MDLNPYFSVITPTYNRGYIIGNMIDSLINQKFEDWELIIVDDGSDDNTGEIIKGYINKFRDNKIKYYKFSINQGVNIARNKGIDLAKGKWFIFQDSDDRFTKNALIDLYNLTKSIETPLLFTACITDSNKILSNKPDYNGYISYEDYLCEKVKGEYMPTVAKYIFEDFRFFEDIKGGERILWNNIAKRFGKVYISNKVIRIYNEDLTDRLSVKKKNFKRLSSVFKKDLKEFGFEYLKYCPLLFTTKLAKLIIYSLLSRDEK